MNPKFYVISPPKVGPGVAAAGFFAPQCRMRHQPADGDQRRDTSALRPEGGIPSVEPLERNLQPGAVAKQADGVPHQTPHVIFRRQSGAGAWRRLPIGYGQK
jgi:hypothetical protein